MTINDLFDHQLKQNLDVGPLLLVNEVAQLLNVHPSTVKRWADRGLLPCYRLGTRGDRRFRRIDIEDFLQRSASPQAAQEVRRPSIQDKTSPDLSPEFRI